MLAPQFELQDQNGKTHTLGDYIGKWLIVYFYPKDDTPGCTKEACSYRDGREEIVKLGAGILGISKDTVASHKKFVEKYKINFPLLSDPDHKIIEAYGAWGEKKFMGRVYQGIKRNTYLIDPKGEIVKKYENVNPLTNASTLVNDLKNLKENNN